MKTQVHSDLRSDTRISVHWVTTIFMILAHIFLVVSQAQANLADSPKLQAFAISLVLLAAVVWTHDTWKPDTSRMFAVVSAVFVVIAAHSWLNITGTFPLLGLPVVLASLLIGFRSAALTATATTAALILLQRVPALRPDTAMTGVALVGVWLALLISYAGAHRSDRISKWASERYIYSVDILEEARDSQLRLEQTIQALANANRQLMLASERMAALRLRAEDAEKTKTAFVSKVSHELRTPLNMIIGLVGLIMERQENYGLCTSPQLVQDLQIIYRNSEHLSDLVDDVLSLTQIETGNIALHRERVSLASLVDSAAMVIQPLLKEKHLEFRTEITDDVPAVYCDRTRIRQVLLNLLSNAARFTEKGGITLRIAWRAEKVIVSVIDTGPGISPDEAEMIFEPFIQGRKMLWQDKKGSGLGLSISRQFVKLHGGRMWVESKIGAGSSFIFELPISPVVEHIGQPGHWIRRDWHWTEDLATHGQATLDKQLGKPRLVVCDEKGDLCRELARLTDEIEIVDTRGLSEAIGEIQRCDALAVVLNTQATKDFEILASEVRKVAPQTLVLGCAVPHAFARATQSSAIGYLTKPVTLESLRSRIQELDCPPRRILVVDDDPSVLDLFRRILLASVSPLEVTTATSGNQALEEMRLKQPDLVLLDIVMPEMDGWQVLERKNTVDDIRDIPVILISANDPRDQPLTMPMIMVGLGHGLSVDQLLRCSLKLPRVLSEATESPGRAPAENVDV